MFKKFFVKFEESETDVNIAGQELGQNSADFTYRIIVYDDIKGSGIVKVFPFGLFTGKEIVCVESPDGVDAAIDQVKEIMKSWHPELVYRELPYPVL